jgi:hypothetical protein
MRSLSTLALLLAVVSPCSAQSPDFLFGQPRGTVAIRSGWMMPRAGSDLFSFVHDQLTVDRKDFDAPSVGLDLDFGFAPRAAAMFGVDFSGSTANSEYRSQEDNVGLPVKQRTTLREANLTGGIKVALTSPGRGVSQHAWIPSSVVPYVGAGAGMMHHTFSQTGDFVDFTDSSVFPHTYSSSGWSPTVHVLGGVDVKAWRRVYVTGEARYLWSHADLSSDFTGFNPIDLAGFRMTGGLRCMF